MATTAVLDGEQRRHDWAGLTGLVLGLTGGAVALYLVAGPPHLPAALPTWDVVLATLRGSYLPPEVLAYLLTSAAWGVWLWMVASLGLRLVAVSAAVLTHGAAWTRSLRAFSDRVTLPVVRKAIDGALVAGLVVGLAARSVAGAEAAPLPAPATVSASGAAVEGALAVSVASAAHSAPPSEASAPAPPGEVGDQESAVDYTVQPRDTLWGISERFYGTGEAFPRLVAANAGRSMPDGQRFTRAGVIRPGWVLRVPLAGAAVGPVEETPSYVVADGDTLSRISARVLDDEQRWPELFRLNRETAALPDGRALRDPDLIWPGLRLRLPAGATAARDHLAGPAPATVSDMPVASESPVLSEPAVAPVATDVVVPEPEALEEEPPGGVSPVPVAAAPAVMAEPVAGPAPTAVGEPEPASGPWPLVYGAAGLAAAGAGGALLLTRRRARRSLSEPPIPRPKSGPPPGEDFADGELARTLVHRLHGGDVEPVVQVAERARRFLDGRDLQRVPLVLAYQGRGATTLLWQAGAPEQSHLVELAGQFGARLGGSGHAAVTPDRDVVWRVGGLKMATLLPPPTERASQLPLLALGIVPGGETLYVNWHGLGHVLVAGLPGGGAEVVLASLVVALTAQRRPDLLRLWTVGSRRNLPPQLAGLPHQADGFVEPEDETRVAEALAELRAAVVRRTGGKDATGPGRAWRPTTEEPELVLVMGELRDMHDDGTALELVGTHGAAVGVRVLAATAQTEGLADEVLAQFSTRIVLQTLDDGESIKLLGAPEAADLGAGELLVRVDGRSPVHARGFRVAAEHLEELVPLMRRAYGAGAPASVSDTDAGQHESDAAVAAAPAATGEWETGGDASHVRVVSRPPEPASAGERETGDDTSGVLGEGSRSGGSATGGADSPAGTDRGEDDPTPAADHAGEPLGVPEEREDGDGTGAARARPSETAPAACESRLAVAVESDAAALPLTDDGAVPAAPPSGATPPLRGQATEAAVRHASGDAEKAAGGDSLLQVYCLGGFVVRSGDREVTPTGEDGPRYKAWEVLAFLAASPGGVASREHLLTCLWPDATTEQAINRMRVAMVRLRGLLEHQVPGLGRDVVRSERDGPCRLDPAAVWCDAQQFWSDCEAAAKSPPELAKEALERALNLYRGELLSARSAHSYNWLDERGADGASPRERYREAYFLALQRLARLYAREGQPALAVPLYRRLLKAEPTLEDVVRELYRCYRRLGDLGSLTREDRHLRQALRDTYYDPEDPEDDPDRHQPEPETVELFNRLRAELEAARGAPALAGTTAPAPGA